MIMGVPRQAGAAELGKAKMASKKLGVLNKSYNETVMHSGPPPSAL